MNSLYKNAKVGERVAGMPQLARNVVHVDGMYERVISLSIGTDTPSGMVAVILSIDELGDGQGMSPTFIGFYPMSQQMHAQEDALLVARKFGLRLRRATAEVGWQWVRTDMDFAEPKDSDIVIGA